MQRRHCRKLETAEAIALRVLGLGGAQAIIGGGSPRADENTELRAFTQRKRFAHADQCISRNAGAGGCLVEWLRISLEDIGGLLDQEWDDVFLSEGHIQ